MISFQELLKRFKFYKTIPNYFKIDAIITDILDYNPTNEIETFYQEFLSIISNKHEPIYQNKEKIEKLSELVEKLSPTMFDLKMEFMLELIDQCEKSYLTDQTRKFEKEYLNQLKSQSELSEFEIAVWELKLKLHHITKLLGAYDEKELIQGYKELTKLTEYCINNDHQDLLFEIFKVIKIKDKTKKTVIKYLKHLSSLSGDLVQYTRYRFLFHIGLTYQGENYYPNYKEKQIWEDMFAQSLEYFVNEGLEFESLQAIHQLANIANKRNDNQVKEELWKNFYDLATKLEATYEIAEGSLELGRFYYSMKNYETAEEYLNQGLELMGRYKSKLDHDLETLSVVQMKLYITDDAIENKKKAIFQSMSPPFWFYCGNEKSMLDASVFNSIIELMDYYRTTNRLNDGIAYLKEVLENKYYTDFTALKSRVTMVLAETMAEVGELDQALEISTKSMETAKNIGYTVQLIRALNLSGRVYFQKEEYNEALEHWQDAFLRYQHWLIETSGYSTIFKYIDLFHKETNQLENDLKYQQTIIASKQNETQTEEYLYSLANIAMNYSFQNKWDDALNTWRKLITLATEADSEYLRIIGLIKIGEISYIKGQIQKYHEYYSKASESIANQINSRPDWGWMYSSSQFAYLPIGIFTLVPEDDKRQPDHEHNPNAKITSGNPLHEGYVWLKRFDLDRAEKRFYKAINAKAKNTQLYAYFLLTCMKLRKGDFQSAEEYSREMYRILEDNPTIFGKETYHLERFNEFKKDVDKLKQKIVILQENNLTV